MRLLTTQPSRRVGADLPTRRVAGCQSAGFYHLAVGFLYSIYYTDLTQHITTRAGPQRPKRASVQLISLAMLLMLATLVPEAAHAVALTRSPALSPLLFDFLLVFLLAPLLAPLLSPLLFLLAP